MTVTAEAEIEIDEMIEFLEEKGYEVYSPLDSDKDDKEKYISEPQRIAKQVVRSIQEIEYNYSPEMILREILSEWFCFPVNADKKTIIEHINKIL